MDAAAGVKWCTVVSAEMPELTESEKTVRVSITIPAEDYADIKKTAEGKRVSIAWVVRDALRGYLKDQAPLLRS